MRVLVVIPYYEPAFLYGGPVRSVSSLCGAMVRAGIEVTVFTTDANGKQRLDVPTDRPVDRDGVRVYYFRRWGRGRFYFSPAFRKACQQYVGEFDLVYSTTMWTYFMWPVLRACQEHDVPRIEAPRSSLMPWALRDKRWKKVPFFFLFGEAQLNKAAAIHCTDQLEASSIEALGLVPPIFVVPNPLETKEFSVLPPRGALRAQLGLPPSSLVSLFMGRLSSRKGLDLSLAAFSHVVRVHPNAYFLIAGPDFGAGKSAGRMVSRLGLADRVRFLGMVSGDKRLAAFADADLFVLASHCENFGMAPAEASAAGIPVLLSDQVAIARRAAETGAAVVVPLKVDEIARAWSELLAHPDRMKAMGKRGRDFVEQEYNPDVVAHKMIEKFREIIQQRASRTRVAGEQAPAAVARAGGSPSVVPALTRAALQEQPPMDKVRQHRVLLLSSIRSVYGAQVLRSAVTLGLTPQAVIIEQRRARGGWPRTRTSIRRYGWLAALFRGLECAYWRAGRQWRGGQPAESVEQAAAECGIRCERVASLNSPAAHELITRYRPELALLGGTGILRSQTLALFSHGILNAHPGILPRYRGNYANRWAFLEGNQCGISVYRLAEVVDAGPILAVEALPWQRGEWPDAFEERATAVCARLVAQTALRFLAGEIQPRGQPPGEGKVYGLMSVHDALRLYSLVWRQKRARPQEARFPQ